MVFLSAVKKAPLVGAFFMSICLTSQALASCPLLKPNQAVQVAKVVDGDTLKLVDGRSVRLIGINAPELGGRGHAEQAFARAAQQRLQQLVKASKGRLLLAEGLQNKDHYGRTLAHVYDNQSRNLEAQLLVEGLGYLVAIAPNTQLSNCQQAAERQARQARLGVWKTSPVVPAKNLEQGGFAVIQGQVNRVQQKRGGLWIELDGPLVLRIQKRWINTFNAQTLKSLQGRRIEARGWVIDRARRSNLKPGQARWMLTLTSPVMLEVLQ